MSVNRQRFDQSYARFKFTKTVSEMCSPSFDLTEIDDMVEYLMREIAMYEMTVKTKDDEIDSLKNQLVELGKDKLA